MKDSIVICNNCKTEFAVWIGDNMCPECESIDLIFKDELLDL